MQHFLKGDNLGLIIGRQGQAVGSMPWNLSFITNSITDFNMYYRGGGMLFPLYLYPETSGQQQMLSGFETLTALDANKQKETPTRTPNLNLEIVNQIAKQLDLDFVPEKEGFSATETINQQPATFSPIDILDYIYAVLHSPSYREKYKEFLKIDFPKIPYPKDAATFWDLAALGKQIREIHLLESPIIEEYITEFNVDGDCVVTKPRFEINPNRVQNPVRVGMVWINETQYFENVLEVAWNFYIGGYQPAQKWLKDRKDRKLEFDDIAHYQKIIVALTETDRLMKAIDAIEIE
jgi:predicted helicase